MTKSSAPDVPDESHGVEIADLTDVYRATIADLRTADSPRLSGTSAEHIRLLAQTEETLPPLLVHRETMRVIDGMHRLEVARTRGDTTIDVRFFSGDSRDAFVLAVRMNVGHGLPLSYAERSAAARRILASHPSWSDRAVGRAAGISAKGVATLRAELPQPDEGDARVGIDGRERPRSAAHGRRRAAEFLVRDPGMPLRQVAKVAGISVSTAFDVQRRLHSGEDPVPSGRRRPERRPVVSVTPVSAMRSASVESEGPAPLVREHAEALLRDLRGDPSLRFSGSGRQLLRLLHATISSAMDRSALMDEVPAHQTGAVAELAEDCARYWQNLAERIKSRDPADSPAPSGGRLDAETDDGEGAG